jgi:TrmH family RNA methyltransferase
VVDIINSMTNPEIKSFKRLHRSRGRSDEMATLIEGPLVFREALDAGVEFRGVLVEKGDDETLQLCADHACAFTIVTAEVLSGASATVHPQSPVAMISMPPPDRMHYRNTLVLRDINDPGNLGTMVRSAGAFGWDVCVTGDSVHPWNPKVIRSGAGAHFKVHLSFSGDPVADARELGLEVAASVVSGGSSPVRAERPMALFIGSEAHGLLREDVEASDRLFTIPIADATESLNAAVAASILMFVLG